LLVGNSLLSGERISPRAPQARRPGSTTRVRLPTPLCATDAASYGIQCEIRGQNLTRFFWEVAGASVLGAALPGFHGALSLPRRGGHVLPRLRLVEGKEPLQRLGQAGTPDRRGDRITVLLEPRAPGQQQRLGVSVLFLTEQCAAQHRPGVERRPRIGLRL